MRQGVIVMSSLRLHRRRRGTKRWIACTDGSGRKWRSSRDHVATLRLRLRPAAIESDPKGRRARVPHLSRQISRCSQDVTPFSQDLGCAAFFLPLENAIAPKSLLVSPASTIALCTWAGP